MSKRAMVTGGAGFLGSHLCERLLADGNSVVCIDDLSTGSLENIKHLKGNPRFEFIEADILDPIDIKVDKIFNFACPASPPKYQTDPIRTLKINVIGIMNLLELARRTGAHVLQASTSEVYGDAEIHPQPETYCGNVNPIGIRSCYDEGKRSAETLLFDYNRVYGVPIKVVRIFNTYGPRMAADDGRVVTNFINQALRSEDITIYGDGSQTRSFCYVDDLIDIITLFANAEDGMTGPLNIGNPGEFEISELANVVLELTGSRSSLVYKPLPSDDPKQRRPDITLAMMTFGWTPKIALREGLQKTIAALHNT